MFLYKLIFVLIQEFNDYVEFHFFFPRHIHDLIKSHHGITKKKFKRSPDDELDIDFIFIFS